MFLFEIKLNKFVKNLLSKYYDSFYDFNYIKSIVFISNDIFINSYHNNYLFNNFNYSLLLLVSWLHSFLSVENIYFKNEIKNFLYSNDFSNNLINRIFNISQNIIDTNFLLFSENDSPFYYHCSNNFHSLSYSSNYNRSMDLDNNVDFIIVSIINDSLKIKSISSNNIYRSIDFIQKHLSKKYKNHTWNDILFFLHSHYNNHLLDLNKLNFYHSYSIKIYDSLIDDFIFYVYRL